jgi:hypothetical protein
MPDAAATAPTEAKPEAAEATARLDGRLAELRELATSSPLEARDQVWSWFEELREQAGHDLDAATATLADLFRAGTPPREIDGQTEGMLVTPLIAGPVDAALRRLTGLWMPWQGKRFHRSEGRGDNVLAGSARFPAKLLWPLYGTKPISGGRAAFDFETRVEEGKDDPGLDVLVIDYAPVESNPGFIIRKIRDELVEIVPGANLGKVLWHGGDDSYSLIGYFALRSPA